MAGNSGRRKGGGVRKKKTLRQKLDDHPVWTIVTILWTFGGGVVAGTWALAHRSERDEITSLKAQLITQQPILPSVSNSTATPDAPHTGNELKMTLEQFQQRVEFLGGTLLEKETLINKSVGKNVHWTVRVQNVERSTTGTAYLRFRSVEKTEQPANRDVASFAEFAAENAVRVLKLKPDDVIELEGVLRARDRDKVYVVAKDFRIREQ